MKSLPFYIPPAWKRYSFRAEPPRIVHCREYPLSPSVNWISPRFFAREVAKQHNVPLWRSLRKQTSFRALHADVATFGELARARAIFVDLNGASRDRSKLQPNTEVVGKVVRHDIPFYSDFNSVKTRNELFDSSRYNPVRVRFFFVCVCVCE